MGETRPRGSRESRFETDVFSPLFVAKETEPIEGEGSASTRVVFVSSASAAFFFGKRSSARSFSATARFPLSSGVTTRVETRDVFPPRRSSLSARGASGASFFGGFHIRKVLAPRGDPSSVTAVHPRFSVARFFVSSRSSSPSSRRPSSEPRTPSLGNAPTRSTACFSGSPMVADVTTNTGSRPWTSRHTRRSRRSKSATCDPKTPRYACASSRTTTESPAKNERHFLWFGRSETCRVSGLVTSMRQFSKMRARSSSGVSPSYAPTSNGWYESSPRSAAPKRILSILPSWSLASALVGNRYSAVAFGSPNKKSNAGAL
mmetsp:Transcript_14326/g.60348  ORF Transcript_14326/g.60348 Transcript_14326/m.60348 type:complete len:318 (-) Transcript_14326:1041-1994(-)